MSTGEQRQAEELNTYLDALQAGEEPPSPPDVPAAQAALLRELCSLARTARPDPRFSQALERRLRAAVEMQAAPVRPRGLRAAIGTWLGGFDRRLAVSLVGALAVIALVLVALAARGIDLPFFRDGTRLALATQATALTPWPTATPPLGTVIALAATATPAQPLTAVTAALTRVEAATATLPPPTATLERVDASPTLPAATPTLVSDTPSPTPVILTATVMATGELGEPPLLPPLTAAMCGADCAELPSPVAWTLDAALPSAPAQVAAFLLRDAAAMTAADAAEMAARLGLSGQVYTPSVVGRVSLVPATDLVIVDEPRQVAFEEASAFVYRDRSVGHGSDLPEGAAVDAAKTFLASCGLLGAAYQTGYAAGTVSFYQVLDGRWPVHGPWARVEVGPAGDVAALYYRGLDLEQQQIAYPLRAAGEAWQQLVDGQVEDRAWYRVDERRVDPRTWQRVYRHGEEAHLFGMPLVLLAGVAEPSHVTLHGLVLQGSVGALVEQYQAVQGHVWGEVQDAGSYQVLVVAGWEDASAQPDRWSGTLRDGRLVTEDGQALPMPSLPTDLPDGTPISVQGGLVDGRLEWSLIEEQVTSPAWCVGHCSATVEEVALVYLVPSPDALSGEPPAASVRALQPAWWFSALTDQGDRISVYVQAVPDAYVDTALGPVPTQP